jgi:hypothetical protein
MQSRKCHVLTFQMIQRAYLANQKSTGTIRADWSSGPWIPLTKEQGLNRDSRERNSTHLCVDTGNSGQPAPSTGRVGNTLAGKPLAVQRPLWPFADVQSTSYNYRRQRTSTPFDIFDFSPSSRRSFTGPLYTRHALLHSFGSDRSMQDIPFK